MSKTDTRRVISEIVLNPSFRQQVTQDSKSALSRYELKQVEIEFLKYLASEGLSNGLDQHLQWQRPTTLGPPKPPGPLD